MGSQPKLPLIPKMYPTCELACKPSQHQSSCDKPQSEPRVLREQLLQISAQIFMQYDKLVCFCRSHLIQFKQYIALTYTFSKHELLCMVITRIDKVENIHTCPSHTVSSRLLAQTFRNNGAIEAQRQESPHKLTAPRPQHNRTGT